MYISQTNFKTPCRPISITLHHPYPLDLLQRSEDSKLEDFQTQELSKHITPPDQSIFLRKLNFVDFNNLIETDKIRDFEVNATKIMLIYNSKSLTEQEARLMIGQLGKTARYLEQNSTAENLVTTEEKWTNPKFFFALYDTYLNSKNGLKMFKEVDHMPCLRIYRKEDNQDGFYRQRCRIVGFEKMLNFVVDHLIEDVYPQTYDV